jgi:hypothetical protein
MAFDLTFWNELMQTEQRQNKHDDDDQTDEVNYSIHDSLRTNGERALNHSANSPHLPKFLPMAAIFTLRCDIARMDALQIPDACKLQFLRNFSSRGFPRKNK